MSIRQKLFVALLVAAIMVVVGMFLPIHWSFNKGFFSYVNMVETKRLGSLVELLQEAYTQKGDWSFLQGNRWNWRRFIAASMSEDPEQYDSLLDKIKKPMEERTRRPRSSIRRDSNTYRAIRNSRKDIFEYRIVLLDIDRKVIAGYQKPTPDITIIPLKSAVGPIGYLGLISREAVLDEQQLQFVQKQKRSFILISLFMIIFAALLSFPLSGRLVQRIKAIAAGTHHLAEGKYDFRLNEGSRDELGQLTRDFNSLALTLEKNEQLRRQWVADISHELRTPLAVLQGEIEALQDGVRKVTPEAIGSLHSEVMRLGRLVGDLYQLSMSDIGALTYRKENVDVAAILDKTVDLFLSEFVEKNISVSIDIESKKAIILFADSERLQQLFNNLLSNSLQYTDAGGELLIRCHVIDGNTEILFQDSSPGVPAQDLGRLFERLYRMESSRSRASGGGGLGLAICRNIVEAHGGTITAEPSPLGGVSIKINFQPGGHK